MELKFKATGMKYTLSLKKKKFRRPFRENLEKNNQ